MKYPGCVSSCPPGAPALMLVNETLRKPHLLNRQCKQGKVRGFALFRTLPSEIGCLVGGGVCSVGESSFLRGHLRRSSLVMRDEDATQQRRERLFLSRKWRVLKATVFKMWSRTSPVLIGLMHPECLGFWFCTERSCQERFTERVCTGSTP